MVDDLKNKLFVLKAKYITNGIIFIVWFLPIFFAPQFEGFVEYGFGLAFAKASYVIPVFLGTVFFVSMILSRKNILASKYGLALLLFMYGHTLLSDVGKYEQVLYFSLYALVVHLVGYSYPKTLFRQYFAVCKMIVVLVLVDYLMYYTMGSTLFHWHELGEAVSGLPRMHTFFNEPFHQATFLMPALLYRLFYNVEKFDMLFIALLFAYLSTLSVGAILLLTVVVAYYYTFKRKTNVLNLLSVIVVSIVVISVAGDFVFQKVGMAINKEQYYNNTSLSSGASYIALRDIAKNTEFTDAIFGVGYYNTGALFANYLTPSDLSNYYLSQGFLEGGYPSIAIVRLFFSYGILGLIVIIYLVKKMFRLSREVPVSIIVIVSLMLVILQESHALDELVFIFFIFGLFWGENWRSTKKINAVQFAGSPDASILN